MGQSNAPSLPLSVDPDTKQRHCSRVRWPRFSQLALRPHPSNAGYECLDSNLTVGPCQKDVRRDVRRRDRGQRPTATKDPNTKRLRREVYFPTWAWDWKHGGRVWHRTRGQGIVPEIGWGPGTGHTVREWCRKHGRRARHLKRAEGLAPPDPYRSDGTCRSVMGLADSVVFSFTGGPCSRSMREPSGLSTFSFHGNGRGFWQWIFVSHRVFESKKSRLSFENSPPPPMWLRQK